MKRTTIQVAATLAVWVAAVGGIEAQTGPTGKDAPSSPKTPVAQTSETTRTASNATNSAKSAKSADAAFLALCDEPTKLRKLDKIAPIWVAVDRSRVVLGGTICLREGALEFFACRRGTKEHESIVSLDVQPHLVCAALLAIGAKQGSPAKYSPKFVPPSGEEIEIQVRWRDAKSGETREVRAQELIREANSGGTMVAPWVFTGGTFGVDSEGKKYYTANLTGETIGVSNFPGSVLDVPFESSADNANLLYEANAAKIPPLETPVALVLTRKNPDAAKKTGEKSAAKSAPNEPAATVPTQTK